MTLTLTLTPDKETRLQEQARHAGLSPEQYVQRLIDRDTQTWMHRAETGVSPTAALFAQWAEEDQTDDPDEIARRQREGDELLQALAENPVSFRRVDVDREDTQDRAA